MKLKVVSSLVYGPGIERKFEVAIFYLGLLTKQVTVRVRRFHLVEFSLALIDHLHSHSLPVS